MKKVKKYVRKYAIIFLALVIVVSSSFTYFYYSAKNAQAAWLGDGWNFRLKLTIDYTKVAADQTDFPIYVDLSRMPLSFHQQVNQIDGRDIRVTKSDGTTELPIEVSFYSASTKTGELHFKYSGTLSSSTNTSIYIYYGNPAASSYSVSATYGRNNVWDSSTVAVWHYSETSGRHLNSTSTAGIDTTTETVTQKGANIGKVGRADEFDGDGDLLLVPSSSSLRMAGDLTIEAWTKLDTTPSVLGHAEAIIYRHLDASPYEEYGLVFDASNNKASFNNASTTPNYASAKTNSGLNAGTWYHIVGVKSGTNMKIYVNGSNANTTDGTYSGSVPNLTGDFFTGDYDNNHNFDLDGIVDEARISSTARSSTWITTAYNNQSSPSTFFLSDVIEDQKRGAVLQFLFDEGYGTTVRDSSPNKYLATLSGATTPTWQGKDMCIAGKCLYYQGTTAYTSVTLSVPNVQSVSFWVRPKTNGETLVDFDGGTHYISASSGVITATGFASPTIYVNGQPGTALIANVWQHVEVTTATAFTASNITIGKRASSYLNGFIDEFRVYDYARTAAQVKTDFAAVGNVKGASVNFGGGPNSSLSQGLVGYWKMDETATPSLDSSGNGNSGTWTNSPTSAAGKFGNAISLDGIDDYISVADNDAFSFSNNTMSASVWVKRSGNPAANEYVVLKGVGTWEYGVYINTSGAFGVSLWSSGGSSIVSELGSNNAVVTDGNWHHIAFTIDGISLKLYIDGRPDDIDPVLTGTMSNTASTLYFGDRSSQVDAEFQGQMDEVRLYNRSLSPAEVAKLASWAPGPVGYWKMDENTGITANDTTGTGNTGTLTSGPTWQPGKFGSNVNFDGSDDYILVTDSNSLDVTTNFTISAWIYGDTFASGEYYIVSKDGVGTDTTGAYNFFAQAGARLCYETNNQGGGNVCTTSGAIVAGSWYHVAVVFDSLTSRGASFFVNGVKQDYNNANTTIAPTALSTNLLIGRRGNAQPFDGKIDDVKIYNYTRTDAQIIEDMNGGNPAPGSPVGSSVAYWKFDEGADNTCSGGTNDICNSGNGGTTLDGTESGMAVPATATSGWTNSGKFNKALRFDGTNDYAQVTDSTALDITGDFTLSAWVSRAGGGDEYVISKTNDSADGGYALLVGSSGEVYCRTNNGTSSTDSYTVTGFINADNIWHHVLATRNGTSCRIYIDGKDRTNYINTHTTLTANANNLRIGSQPSGGNYMNGRIDEVKIYSGAFTADQVKVEYNRGSGQQIGALSTDSSNNPSNSATDSYCQPGQGSTCTPPVLHWKMDENTGTTSTFDISTNGYTGTLNGSMTQSNWVPGKLGSTINFDGTDDRIQNTSISLPTGDFTYIGWIYPTTLGSSNIIFGAPQASIGGNEIAIDTDTDGDIDVILDNGTLVINGTNGLITANNWYHVVVTRSGSTVTSYINGKVDITGTEGDALSLAACGINIGSGQASTSCSAGLGSYFQGKIDDVKIYNYARTQAQVAWDYNRGAPIGWWKMDEASWNNDCSTNSVFDSSGNTKHGNACPNSTGPVGGGIGKLNSGGSFDGSNDYVQILSPSLPTGDFSYTAWFYVDDLNEDRTILMASDGSGNVSEMILRVVASSDPTNPSKIEFAADDTAAYSTTAIQTGRWYHVTYTRAGSTMRVYINGILDPTTGSDSTALNFSTCRLYIGLDIDSGTCASPGGLGYYFDGMIDDVRVYNYPLTIQQIKTIMNDGSIRFGPATGAP